MYVTEIVTVKLTAGSEELSTVISTISHASAQVSRRRLPRAKGRWQHGVATELLKRELIYAS